jgi:hypothetical protein
MTCRREISQCTRSWAPANAPPAKPGLAPLRIITLMRACVVAPLAGFSDDSQPDVSVAADDFGLVTDSAGPDAGRGTLGEAINTQGGSHDTTKPAHCERRRTIREQRRAHVLSCPHSNGPVHRLVKHRTGGSNHVTQPIER